jgi:hypothetical protein
MSYYVRENLVELSARAVFSPDADTLRIVHKYLHHVRRNSEEVWYFKTINISILMDHYADRDGLEPWAWPLMLEW